jgi:5-methylcytosine-specific restriction enzyme A
MSHPFVVGRQYSRKDVRRLLGLEDEEIRGIWSTGYVRHEDDWFIFTNIEAAGTTGHNYNNRWVDGKLHWSGKRGSRRGQPSIQSLLSSTVFIFTRENARDPFVFAGIGLLEEVGDDVPVRVVWKFGRESATTVSVAD